MIMRGPVFGKYQRCSGLGWLSMTKEGEIAKLVASCGSGLGRLRDGLGSTMERERSRATMKTGTGWTFSGEFGEREEVWCRRHLLTYSEASIHEDIHYLKVLDSEQVHLDQATSSRYEPQLL